MQVGMKNLRYSTDIDRATCHNISVANTVARCNRGAPQTAACVSSGYSGNTRPAQLSSLPVLSNISLPSLRLKSASDAVLKKAASQPDWPVYNDIHSHALSLLQSHEPIWSSMTPINVTDEWSDDWRVGFRGQRDLSVRSNSDHQLWSMLNRFRTGQGQCAANLHKLWNCIVKHKRLRGQPQTTNPSNSHLYCSKMLMMTCYDCKYICYSPTRWDASVIALA